MNKERTLSLIRQRFANLSDIGTELVRAERNYDGSPVGVFYFDFSQVLGRTEFNLAEYLQHNIAKDFYQHEGSLQWNYYLYFILERALFNQVRNDGRAAQIEADRTFARKIVTEEELFDNELKTPITAIVHSTAVTKDIAAIWTRALNEASLQRICDPKAPYTEIIKNFLAGTTENGHTRGEISGGTVDAKPGRFIESLRIEKFRSHPSITDFEFGGVNLIRGINGSGKTSLLEAIELCICGAIRRQDGGRPSGTRLFIRFQGDDRPQQCPDSNLARYRSRDQTWYSAYYPKGNQLCQNFNRFNFFDSDAAFRLSSANSRQEIQEAIHTLFLGELANTLEERMGACKDRFKHEERELANTILALRKDVTKLLVDIERLKRIRDTRQALLQELQIKASSVGWKTLPSRFTLQALITLQESVDELSSQLGEYVQQLRWLPNVSVQSLEEQSKELARSLKELKDKQESAEHVLIAIEKSNINLARAQAEMKILTRLQEYHVEPDALSLRGCAVALKASRSKIDQLKQAVTLMRGVDTKAFEESTKVLGAYITEHEGELTKQRRIVAQKRRRVTELQTQFGAVKALIEQIKGLGRRFCETNPNSQDCPLCGAHYERGDLLNHIASLETDSTLDSSLRELVADSAGEEARLTALEKSAESLGKLRQAAAFLLPPLQVVSRSTKFIVQILLTVGEKLEEENFKLQELTVKLARLRLRGYAEAELEKLLSEATEVYELPQSRLLSSTGLRTIIATRNERISALLKEVRDTTKEQREVEMALSRFVRKAVGNVELEDASVELERRKTLVEEVLKVIRRAARNISIVDSEEFSVFRNRLKTFGDAITRIEEALKRVEEKNVLEQQFSTSLAEARKRLGELEPRHDRAKRALEILTELMQTENKQKYLRDVVNQHSEKLVAIFCKIHAPSDFKNVRINGDVLLERHSGDKSSVAEISAGQRSALAVSIFLSLNSSVSNRAPWLIFDDPVVHVDDLNTLSFLDTLRDLVLLGNRQVFFATANTRIANLFTRKFDFLGKSSFKDFPLERSDR